jgi:hypothetical protein
VGSEESAVASPIFSMRILDGIVLKGHGFIRAGTLREKRTGFTGCGKTHPGQHIRQFCNKGTASAGPKRVAKNGPALAAEGCFWDEETSLRA